MHQPFTGFKKILIMKKYFLLLLLVSGLGFSQGISEYKFVIVPSKFDAQNKAGQYGLNNLTKLFLEKNGYTPFFDTDILPPEVSGESCNKIYLDVVDDNSMMTTKLKVIIKDCRNAVLFTSEYGKSNDKDNNVAYNQALRAAFKSFDKPEYKYNPSAAKSQPGIAKPVVSNETKPKDQEVISVKPISIGNVLNAQEIVNGYQLVDNTPKIILRIYHTSQPEIFLAESDSNKGIVMKKDGQWVFEYYQGEKFFSRQFMIKF
jgi:hypothetical protein